MSGVLYVVGTPIGNLEDLSPRAARILRQVALVAAEDTRSAKILLTHAGSSARVTSYFEGNEAARTDDILRALGAGNVALISEAGMPGVSDPGERVIAAAIAAGAKVEVIPGPTTPGAIVHPEAAVRLPGDWTWDLADQPQPVLS